MPYPNDPDVMRGDKERYYVTAPQQAKKGPYTQSDAIRVATELQRKYRARAAVERQKAHNYRAKGWGTHARDAESRAQSLQTQSQNVKIEKA